MALTSYNPEKLMGNKTIAYKNIMLREDQNRVKKDVEKQIRKRQPFEIKYRIHTKNNKVRWI